MFLEVIFHQVTTKRHLMNWPVIMFNVARRKIGSPWEKNGPDIRAAFSGTLPRFLRTTEDPEGEIPVFVFHSVEPARFEEQLGYLANNGYTTLDAKELVAALQGGTRVGQRTVALTFDDATGSFWAVAFPLLKKYGFRAILFAISGLVPDDDHLYPNLEDVWRGQATYEEIANRECIQPLCTWSELLNMHQSGVVDVQSHSLTHARINVSSKVVDFIHPRFNTYSFENVSIPISRNDSVERPLRRVRLGEPVYESASRLSGGPRFLEDSRISEKLVQYVEHEGGTAFFSRFNWRSKLYRIHRSLVAQTGMQTEYETPQQTERAIKMELSYSQELLEKRLPGKTIQHLCYPWFQGSSLADRIAGECGYRSVFYGLESGANDESKALPLKIRRVSEEYLFCLPGQGRRSMSSVWTEKISRLARGSTWRR